MNKTNIEWTDFSSNPIRAINTANGKMGWYCTRVSAGCTNCFAATLNMGRFGNGLDYTVPNCGKAKFVLVEKEFEQWKSRKKPAKIFVADMTDLFHEDIPYEMIYEVFKAMDAAPQHIFQVLTKRPARMKEFVYRLWRKESGMLELCKVDSVVCGVVLPNLWIGTSVEDQSVANERIPLLLQTPAAVRFLSCEPLLGSIDLNVEVDRGIGELALETNPRINLLICGGESGKGFRAMDLDWARGLRNQCKKADIPFFFKQQSGLYPGTNPTLDGIEYHELPKCKSTTTR